MKGKKYFALVAVLMFIAVVTSAFGAGPAVKTDRVVYLINGALGDNAFYDSGEAGIKNIEKQYKLQTRTIECNFDAGKYEPALQAAVDYAGRHGARCVEAYPMDVREEKSSENLFTGLQHVFESCGFVEAARRGNRPILRKVL